jgi:hypothetical protein
VEVDVNTADTAIEEEEEEGKVGTVVGMVSKVFENKEDYVGIFVKYLVRMWK